MDIATWNVNSLRQRLEHFDRWTEESAPDVICLQETKVVDSLFPHDAIREAGYEHQLIHGQKSYNGVAILSKYPLSEVQIGFADSPADPQARLVKATIEGIRIINCYVPNGSPVGSPKFQYKLDWLKRLTQEMAAVDAGYEEVLLCGDMNIAPDDADVFDPFEAEGLLTTPAERNALKALLSFGLKDAYRRKNPFSTEYSWWDYRGSAFRYNHGFRIDHIFLTKPLMKQVKKVRIDRQTRTWERPTDHAPVVVTLKRP